MEPPRKIVYFECPYCSMIFDNEDHAKLCMHSHLHPEELEIKNVATLNAEDSVYEEGNKFPNILKVIDKNSDNFQFYKRIELSSGSTANMPLLKGEVTLRRKTE